MKNLFKSLLFTIVGLSIVGFSFVFANGGVNPDPIRDPDVCLGGECPNLPEPTHGEHLLDSAKIFINYALGLLALIALGVILRGGFQMVTAAGDDGKYKSGFTILKQAAVGLVFIALAWIIVRFIFFVIGFVVS